MDASKKYMKDNGIGSRISFADGAKHKVKLLRDKEDEIPDGKGGKTKGMKYLVEENGEQKTIFTSSVGLISKLADCESGDVVEINMYKANNKSYYKVTKEGAEVTGEDMGEGGSDVSGGGEEEQPAW